MSTIVMERNILSSLLPSLSIGLVHHYGHVPSHELMLGMFDWVSMPALLMVIL
jgi:hypothetical protein